MSKKKYIDADRLSRQISDTRLNLPHDSKDFFTRDFMLLNFQQTIDLEPAADVVEVVRCKDCKWRGTEKCAMFYECDCGEQYTRETDDDFCSYGERADK